ncbi:MAG: hypothetical protein ACXVXC_01660 [Nocardioidaceae bacterium]
MRSAYRYLAYAIPVLVAVQAAVIAFGFFGLSKWVDDGHDLTKSVADSGSGVTGNTGLVIHALNGEILIPLVAIALLVVSFFAKIPGGVKWASFVFGDVVLQFLLAGFAFGVPAIGLLHGINAIVLFGLGMMAGQFAGKATAPAAAQRETV